VPIALVASPASSISSSGEGVIYTLTTITAAPTGFDDLAPYTVAVVDLAEGGRLLGWIGETIPRGEARIGMPVQVVPRIFEEQPDIKVYYTIEQPGTTWGKAPAPSSGAAARAS
jgi:uncharacterized OB-fold protein